MSKPSLTAVLIGQFLQEFIGGNLSKDFIMAFSIMV